MTFFILPLNIFIGRRAQANSMDFILSSSKLYCNRDKFDNMFGYCSCTCTNVCLGYLHLSM